MKSSFLHHYQNWKKNYQQKKQNWFCGRIIQERIISCNSEIDDFSLAELKSVQFTQQDFQNNLSKQRALIEWLQFHLTVEEQKFAQEELDLELIQKELGELFIQESLSYIQMVKIIDSLPIEANFNKRDQYLKELDEATQQLDDYIENISEMGQQLRLITDFVNQIRKNLLRVEGKINQMKKYLNNIGNDIKFLKGKSVEQLLEIRKWKVLKEAAYKNVKFIYVPFKTQEEGEKEPSILMNLEQFDDKVGEVNEFLQQKKTVMLIHGIAGSGKSTTAKKIEEFIWKLHELNKKIKNQVLIPIYISLPSLKNPVLKNQIKNLNFRGPAKFSHRLWSLWFKKQGTQYNAETLFL